MVGYLYSPYQDYKYLNGSVFGHCILKNFIPDKHDLECLFRFIKKENEKNKYYITTDYHIGYRSLERLEWRAACLHFDPGWLYDDTPTVSCALTGVNGMINNNIDDNAMTWEIIPAESFTMENIEYYINPGDMVNTMPEFLTTAIVTNQTSVQQGVQMHFSEKATEQSRFSETEGFTVQMSASVNVGIPVFNANGSISQSSSSTWSFENSQSKEDSRSYDFPVNVAPYTKVTATASVTRYSANVTYVATVKGNTSGKRLQLTGTWIGVTAGNINYTLVESPLNSPTNAEVKTYTFSGIPQQTVDLSELD
ncbi:MAG: hypothetical protein LUE98_10090 [Tannerellaceae bacterium]|nr:hypothetical protein [Tannerellaceae bacterium]